MMWCSSTIAPAMSVPHVPSIALRWRSSRKIPTRLRPMRSQRQLDRALQDRVGLVEREDLVERRQQRRQLAVHRLIDDLGYGDLRSQDDRPVHASAPSRHGGSLTSARIAERAAWARRAGWKGGGPDVDNGPPHGDLKGHERRAVGRAGGLRGQRRSRLQDDLPRARGAWTRRGHLNMPVDRRGALALDAEAVPRARAPTASAKHGRPADRKALPAAARAPALRAGEYHEPATYAAIAARAGRARSGRRTTSRSRPACSRSSSRASTARAARRARVWSSRSRSGATWPRRAR